MRTRPFAVALALVAGAALAQPVPAPEPPAPAPPPPALVPAPEAPPAPPRARPARAGHPLQRIPRVTAELVLGAGSAAAVAYGGYQLGCALSGASTTATNCGAAGTYGGLSGFALGIPIGVMLGGSLLDGDGSVLPTAFATGFGLAVGLGGVVFLQRSAPDANPLPLVAIPLAFAVIGYELSSHDSRTAAQAEARGKHLAFRILPTGALLRGGAALGFTLLLP